MSQDYPKICFRFLETLLRIWQRCLEFLWNMCRNCLGCVYDLLRIGHRCLESVENLLALCRICLEFGTCIVQASRLPEGRSNHMHCIGCSHTGSRAFRVRIPPQVRRKATEKKEEHVSSRVHVSKQPYHAPAMYQDVHQPSILIHDPDKTSAPLAAGDLATLLPPPPNSSCPSP